MTKNLFIHCGLPKTGSTSIQKFCAKKKNFLFRLGLDYINDKRICFNQINVGPVAFSMLPELPLPTQRLLQKFGSSLVPIEESWSACRELIEASPAQNILISSEDFIHVPPEEWPSRLAELTSNISVRFVAYIRDMPSYLCSNWAQAILDYPTMTMPLEPYVLADDDNAIYQPYRHILALADVVGDEKILIRPFEPNQWWRNDVTLDLLHSIGIDDSGFKAPPKQNASSHRHILDFMRTLNAMSLSDAQNYLSKLTVLKSQLSKGPGPKAIDTLSGNVIEQIVEKRAGSYANLTDRFGAILEYPNSKPRNQETSPHSFDIQLHARLLEECIKAIGHRLRQELKMSYGN